MAIVSSTYVVGHSQIDGRSYVVETHAWSGGKITHIEYGPVPIGSDYASIATARAGVLQEIAAQEEFEGLIGGA